MGRDYFYEDATTLARKLIGASFFVHGIGGIIVETEAYNHEDPASHSYLSRKTARNAVMFGPPGHAYVYRSYGIHWCMNFVCGKDRLGAAVLIRALQPTSGIDIMQRRRGLENPRMLCSGPGRLCEALAITGVHTGMPLAAPPFSVIPRARRPAIAIGPRIGITKAADKPWRFGLAGSPFLSKRFPLSE